MPTINGLRDPEAAEAVDARVLSLHRGPTVAVLPEGDLERLHAAILTTMERVGVAIWSARVAERLRTAGAMVDVEAMRVRFPASLVEEALVRAPRELTLGARDPACDLRVGGRQGWLGAGGRAARVVDLGTDTRRPPVLADLATLAHIADAQPQVGIVGPPPPALDVPETDRPLVELRTLLASTTKHVHVEAVHDRQTARALLEIATLAAGNATAFRARPLVSALAPLGSPLTLDGLDAVEALAAAGMPSAWVATPGAGRAMPPSLAGALVTTVAGSLAGIVALQLLVPSAPTFLATRTRMTRPDDGPPRGSHDLRFAMAWTQLAHRLGVPAYVGGATSGAKSSDWQAGMEDGLAATATWMTGPDVRAGAGLRDGGRLFSPVAMLLDAEVFDLVRRIPLGFAVDDDTLALEVIEKVGPGEHFLGEPHTVRHMREAWRARFMDTEPWEAWEEAGRPQPPERARARALEVLASHEPTPLPSQVRERIEEVIAEHARDHR